MQAKLIGIAAAAIISLAPSAARAEEYILSAELKGANEVPGPGDADGSGVADLTLDSEKLRLCYTITVSNVASPTMAHIHSGTAATAGDPVVTLDAPAKGSVKNCMDLTKSVADAIVANPAGHYINVHSEEFPAGAVRGQLVVE